MSLLISGMACTGGRAQRGIHVRMPLFGAFWSSFKNATNRTQCIDGDSFEVFCKKGESPLQDGVAAVGLKIQRKVVLL